VATQNRWKYDLERIRRCWRAFWHLPQPTRRRKKKS